MSAHGEGFLLGPVQRKIVAAALSFLAVILIVSLALLVFFILQRVVSFFSGVIWPLAVAGILALILRPLVKWLERVFKLSRNVSIIVLYAFVLLAGCGLLALVAPAVISQVTDFVNDAPTLLNNAREFLQARYPGLLDNLRLEWFREYFDTLLEGLKQMAAFSMPVIREAGVWVFGLFGATAAVAIIPIYLFYFLQTDRDPTHDLGQELVFLSPQIRQDLLFLMREFATILVAFFRGQLLIGLIMGILLATGFTLVGLKFGLMLGLLIGILNIIPYLGTILGLATVLPIAFFQPEGGWILVALALVVFFAVQVIEGYLLTPKIMGKQTGLHPLAVIISIFFWGTALKGLLGMVLAIPLTAFFIIAWRLLKRKYLTQPQEAQTV